MGSVFPFPLEKSKFLIHAGALRLKFRKGGLIFITGEEVRRNYC